MAEPGHNAGRPRLATGVRDPPNWRLYEALEVPRHASAAEITRAYRRLARVHHPDKGGDAAQFRVVTRAHEVLGNAALRAAYDAGGEAAVSATETAAGARAPAHYRPVVVTVALTLADICTDVERLVPVSRAACADASQASGGPRRFEVAMVKVVIPRGAPNGCIVVKDGEGHMRTGALVVKVEVGDAMGSFRRKGIATLEYDLRVSLWQALLGGVCVQVPVLGAPAGTPPHRIRLPDRVLRPGDVLEVPDLGLPLFNCPGGSACRGPLHLVVTVLFPDRLPKGVARSIAVQAGAPLDDVDGSVLDPEGTDADADTSIATRPVDTAAHALLEATASQNLRLFIEDQQGPMTTAPAFGPTVQCAQA